MHRDHDPEFVEWVAAEMAQFREHVTEAANASGDQRLAVLLTHLYTEHLLERYLKAKLPKGERLLKDEFLMYQKKLDFAAALGELDNQLIDGLGKLNKLRNNCAHKFKYSMDSEELEKLGKTLGKEYSEFKEKYPNDEHGWLGATLPKIAERLATVVASAEIGKPV
ncbi:hypothetical protein [Methylohalobius crimeensis]|uniref:hypothetical protein n=1 Tax=Methylohalobius crimeensis TaxID=244365 RepID=UPI0003B76444|nr:hypothetical protein [Methylohalobius crimeensis]